MPIKKKTKRTLKKPKYNRRKYYRRKYKKQSRSKARRYHKRKWYKKYSRKRMSIYRARGMEGIKYTRYLDLAEFLSLPNHDLYSLMAAVAFGKTISFQSNQEHTIGSGFAVKNWFSKMCKQALSKTFNVYATEGLDPIRVKNYPSIAQNYFWKAWNPVINSYTLGPYFDSCQLQYRMFKFAGVKVKWIPANKPVTQITYPTNTVYTAKGAKLSSFTPKPYQVSASVSVPAGGTGYTLIDGVEVANAKTMPAPFDYKEVTSHDYPFDVPEPLAISPTITNWTTSPPHLRFWLNASKQGYESFNDIKVDIVEGSGEETGQTIQNNRLKFAALYDKQGNYKYSNSKIRSFSFDKPFKFYVRPYLQRKASETTENANVLTNYEKNIPNVTNALYELGGINEIRTQPRKMPWVSVLDTCPEDKMWTFGANSAETEPPANAAVVLSFVDDMVFNPILFSWMITDDASTFDRITPLFNYEDSGYANYTSEDYQSSWSIKCLQYYRSMGKFKVTFYAKYKGRKQVLQVFPTKDEQKANAMEQE